MFWRTWQCTYNVVLALVVAIWKWFKGIGRAPLFCMAWCKVGLLLFSMGEGCFALSMHPEEPTPRKHCEKVIACLSWADVYVIMQEYQQMQTVYCTQVFTIRKEVNRPTEPHQTPANVCTKLLLVWYFWHFSVHYAFGMLILHMRKDLVPPTCEYVVFGHLWQVGETHPTLWPQILGKPGLRLW